MLCGVLGALTATTRCWFAPRETVNRAERAEGRLRGLDAEVIAA